jgi:hypothetical protein
VGPSSEPVAPKSPTFGEQKSVVKCTVEFPYHSALRENHLVRKISKLKVLGSLQATNYVIKRLEFM